MLLKTSGIEMQSVDIPINTYGDLSYWIRRLRIWSHSDKIYRLLYLGVHLAIENKKAAAEMAQYFYFYCSTSVRSAAERFTRPKHAQHTIRIRLPVKFPATALSRAARAAENILKPSRPSQPMRHV
eukprot:gnl/TRDRNA2_/TRDRNA2_4591_c1_seq1.p2 gnl/TRDRNA2_/TRDRNA2_4591_c1~~gnl/TRDRNA2_/TRDRNA2_4591_c1_seq1.p2  ORF type:complete len:126 (-),score=15.48 gnl/TRDRNA2_/TRDRNA2_4591_c1_seq1:61-438(-)